MTKTVDHQELPRRPAHVSDGDPRLLDAIVDHLDGHVGEATTVSRDSDRTYICADVVVVPRARDGAVVLCTSGMAERQLYRSEEDDEGMWTELVMVLPETWPISAEALREPQYRWPMAWLRYLARLPHATTIGFGANHSIGPLFHGPRATPFNGALFVECSRLPRLEVAARTITFLAVCPLHPEEAELAGARGARHVIDALSGEGWDVERVVPDRASISPPAST